MRHWPGGGQGHFIGPQDLDAGQELDGVSGQVFPEPAQFVQVEDRGGDEKLGARGQLLFEFDELGTPRFGLGDDHGAEEEDGAAGQGQAGAVMAVHEPGGDLQQLHRVGVVDRLGLGVVPEGDVIAADQEEIFQPQAGGPQQVALKGQAVAIPAGEVHQGFAAGLLDQAGRGHGRQSASWRVRCPGG